MGVRTWHDDAIAALEAEIRESQALLDTLRRRKAGAAQETQELVVPPAADMVEVRGTSKWCAPIDEVLSKALGHLTASRIVEQLKANGKFNGMKSDPEVLVRRILQRFRGDYGWKGKKHGRQILWRKETA